MNILSSLLYAISANTDNFVVGLSYGIKKIKVGHVSNLLISFITMIGTILSMLLSKGIVKLLPINGSNVVGSTILILIGVWTIVKPLIKGVDSDCILDNPEKADKDNSSTIDVKESIILALALSINNVGLGIGASITGLNILLTSILTFVLSFLMITFGCYLGSYYFSKLFSKRATIVSGVIIITLGIFEALN